MSAPYLCKWHGDWFLTVKAARPLRIHGENRNGGLVCVELRGRLNDKSAASLSKCNVAIRVQWIKGRMEEYYHLIADVASQLAWIVAAFKQPPEDGLSFTSAKIEDSFPMGDLSQDGQDRCSVFRIEHTDSLDQCLKDGTCWHPLFTGLNVAVGFPTPHRPDGMHGVELPLSILTTFSGCGYAVAYKDGFVLKGWQNALFPVRTDSDSGALRAASALQWHLFKSERHRLYIAEAKKTAPDLLPVRTELSLTEFCTAVEQTERHFLGLYQAARFRIGTNDSRADMIATIHADDRLEETRLRGLLEWTRIINFSFGGGKGVSLGASTGIRVRKVKERLLSLDLERGQRNIINATKTNSTILFNVKTRVAWMLPQICVVMYLVQAWTKKYYPDTQIDYPDFHDMSENGLDRALDRFKDQQDAKRIELMGTFEYFAKAFDQLQDDEKLKPAKRAHPKQLAGIDFAQLATKPKTYSILTTDIDIDSGGNWLQMLKSDWKDMQTRYETRNAPYRVVTLFCDNLTPQPILPTIKVCDTWLPPPFEKDYLVTAMHCLRELTELYGRDPARLSCEHCWKRGLYSPFQECNGRSCNRLQNIVQGTGRRDEDISQMIRTASPAAAVVFGRVFDVDPRLRCTLIEAGQGPPPPPQRQLELPPLRRPPPPPPPPPRLLPLAQTN